ncbi:membrane-spanning 4-domains subfamily A member 4D-like isoform X1 [Colossoma macropomum]|uniref:membrane-spanning 4-domains subfamily A member 4D-like isoform X1 n=1 Tax=Colossoma macropomum TaxID=42526 RepID=UPI001864750E|nr:membrane-spanning 4-domains subfamily A member 4D-like isoform X1 [Colossoma macropomum]
MSDTAASLSNTGGGYTIVTHVISPPTSTEPGQIVSTGGPLQKFLKGEPKALGIVQIMIGLLTFLLGILITYYRPALSAYSGIVFWGALVYISTGSLAVSASNKLHHCVVRGALVMNVLSTIIAGLATILLSLDLMIVPLLSDCIYGSRDPDCISEHLEQLHLCYVGGFPLINCLLQVLPQHFYRIKGLTMSVLVVLLIFSIVQFFISIFVSTFACKATCSAEPSVNITVVSNQAGCPPYTSEQYPLNAVNGATMNNPPVESPPAYSEIKGQTDN